MPTICPLCETLAATAEGCTACGSPDVLPTRTTFVVTGASGSGKTTVAHHLHAVLRPTMLPGQVPISPTRASVAAHRTQSSGDCQASSGRPETGRALPESVGERLVGGDRPGLRDVGEEQPVHRVLDRIRVVGLVGEKGVVDGGTSVLEAAPIPDLEEISRSA